MLGAPDTMVGSGQWDPCRIPRGTWPEQTPMAACMVLWSNSNPSICGPAQHGCTCVAGSILSQDPCSQSHAIIVISHAIIASAFHPVATADHGKTPPVRTHSLDHNPSEFTIGEAIHTHHGTPVLGPNAACVPRVAVNSPGTLNVYHGPDRMSDRTSGAWSVYSLDGLRARNRPELTKWALTRRIHARAHGARFRQKIT